MHIRSMYGLTGPYGHRVLVNQKTQRLFRQNWTGIYGLVLLRLKIIKMVMPLLTGVVTGALAPAHWEIWVAI